MAIAQHNKTRSEPPTSLSLAQMEIPKDINFAKPPLGKSLYFEGWPPKLSMAPDVVVNFNATRRAICMVLGSSELKDLLSSSRSKKIVFADSSTSPAGGAVDRFKVSWEVLFENGELWFVRQDWDYGKYSQLQVANGDADLRIAELLNNRTILGPTSFVDSFNKALARQGAGHRSKR